MRCWHDGYRTIDNSDIEWDLFGTELWKMGVSQEIETDSCFMFLIERISSVSCCVQLLQNGKSFTAEGIGWYWFAGLVLTCWGIGKDQEGCNTMQWLKWYEMKCSEHITGTYRDIQRLQRHFWLNPFETLQDLAAHLLGEASRRSISVPSPVRRSQPSQPW